VLVDWFVDVCAEYGLSNATFFLAVSLVDRTLSVVDCPRNKLQLLGATAMFIASKIEDVYPPQLSEIVFMTEETYTASQVRRMEKVILQVTKFELNVPLTHTFAEFYAFFEPMIPEASSLMWYLLELSTMHFDCLRFKYSCLAAAAFALAVHATERSDKNIGDKVISSKAWTDKLELMTGINRDQLKDPADVLLSLYRAAEGSHLQAIFLKYSLAKHMSVSTNTDMMTVNTGELFS